MAFTFHDSRTSERAVVPRQVTALCLALAAWVLLLRWPLSSVPLPQDEGLYLTIANSILRGGSLYVDCWDNKPIGIFLIYAGVIKALGASEAGVRLASDIAVFSGALVLGALLWRMAGRTAAVIGAFVFPAYMLDLGADGAPAETFMNVPIALSVLCVLGGVRSANATWALARCAFMFGLLQGIAFQIKFPTVFISFSLGVTFFVLVLHSSRSFSAALLVAATSCAGFVVPTAGVFAYFAATGTFADMYFANFISPRFYVDSPFGWADPALALQMTARRVSYFWPLLVAAAAAVGTWVTARVAARAQLAHLAILGSWLLGAVAAAESAGYFRYVYFILCAPPAVGLGAFSARHILCRLVPHAAVVAVVVLTLYPIGLFAKKEISTAASPGGQLDRATIALAKSLTMQGQVAFFGDLSPILYTLTDTVPATKYPLAIAHIFDQSEKFGVDAARELKRVFDRGPDIVMGTRLRLGLKAPLAVVFQPLLDQRYERVELSQPELRDQIVVYRKRLLAGER